MAATMIWTALPRRILRQNGRDDGLL